MTQTPEEIAPDIMDQAYRGDAEATLRRDIALAIRKAEERGAAQERERLRAEALAAIYALHPDPAGQDDTFVQGFRTARGLALDAVTAILREELARKRG